MESKNVGLPLFKIIIIIIYLISRVTNYSLILASNFSHVYPCHPFQQMIMEQFYWLQNENIPYETCVARAALL